MMKSRIFKVEHAMGMCGRPCAAMTNEVSKYDMNATIEYDNQIRHASSIIEWLCLAIPCGSEFTIHSNSEALFTGIQYQLNKFKLNEW